MNLRTGGDGRLTQLSRYERDTMVFVRRKGTHHVILFLEILFSFNKFNHCRKQGQEFVVVPRLLVVALFRQRLYNP